SATMKNTDNQTPISEEAVVVATGEHANKAEQGTSAEGGTQDVASGAGSIKDVKRERSSPYESMKDAWGENFNKAKRERLRNTEQARRDSEKGLVGQLSKLLPTAPKTKGETLRRAIEHISALDAENGALRKELEAEKLLVAKANSELAEQIAANSELAAQVQTLRSEIEMLTRTTKRKKIHK
ncbi:hypothetical protein IW150_000563, partial [Coemansia sp. RSA 2607]